MNFPILSSITFIPLIGALFIFLTKEEKNEKNKGAIYVSIFTSFVNFFITLFLVITEVTDLKQQNTCAKTGTGTDQPIYFTRTDPKEVP